MINSDSSKLSAEQWLQYEEKRGTIIRSVCWSSRQRRTLASDFWITWHKIKSALAACRLESHVVTYAPSGTLLYLVRNSPMTHATTLPFLGLGDVQYGRDRNVSNKNSPAQTQLQPELRPTLSTWPVLDFETSPVLATK